MTYPLYNPEQWEWVYLRNIEDGYTYSQLAEFLDVSDAALKAQMARIRRARPPLPPLDSRAEEFDAIAGRDVSPQRYTQEQIDWIWSRRREGYTWQDLGDFLGLAAGTTKMSMVGRQSTHALADLQARKAEFNALIRPEELRQWTKTD